MQGTLLNSEGKPLWIPFKYERLPNFCFKYGMIKYVVSSCTYTKMGNKIYENEYNQYWTWLKASSLRPTHKNPSQSSKKKSFIGSSSYEKWAKEDKEVYKSHDSDQIRDNYSNVDVNLGTDS